MSPCHRSPLPQNHFKKYKIGHTKYGYGVRSITLPLIETIFPHHYYVTLLLLASPRILATFSPSFRRAGRRLGNIESFRDDNFPCEHILTWTTCMTHRPHEHALIIVDGEMGKLSSNKFVITSNTGAVGNCAWPMSALAFSTERCLKHRSTRAENRVCTHTQTAKRRRR
jgi:hypothetical protein